MLNVLLRTVIIYFTLLILMRMLGKRQMGEMELSELIVSFLVADVASVPLQSPDLPLSYGLAPCAALFALEYLMSRLTMGSVRLRQIFCGQPSFLIVKGQILQKAMRKNRFTVDELSEELRSQGVTDIATVQYAVLETDGTLNVILYPEERPATLRDLRITVEDDGYATVLIEDGTLLEGNLRHCGLDKAWLKKELTRRGCASAKQIYAMIYYDSGKIYFAEKD